MVATVIHNREFSLYPKQLQFRENQSLFRAFAAGIGSGKSKIGAYDLICRAKPNRLYLVVAPTYGLMHDASFRTFEEVAQSLGLIVPGSIARGTMPHMKIFVNGGIAEIIFRSTENFEMLRGANLSGIWWDEASISKEGAYYILIGRLREGGELGWMTLTFTPKGKASWTYKEFCTGKPDTWFIRAKTSDNPFLADDFYRTRASKMSEKMRKQELDGLDLDDGGNWFNPGTWPRYYDIAQGYAIPLGNRIRKTYHWNDCTRIITLDWALNKVKRSAEAMAKRLTEDKTDFNAFVVCDLTRDGNLIILDCVNERIPMEGKAPALAALCRRWRPFIVAADDDMLSETLQLDVRRYKDIPEIRTLPIAGKGKVERATASIIRGENGLIYLPENPIKEDGSFKYPWIETFTDSVASFTGIDDEHDDIVDALGIQGRLADELKGTGGQEAVPEVLTPGQNLYGW